MNSLSFNKGLRDAKHGDIPAIKAQIMTKLGITTRQAYAKRRDGKVMHTIEDVHTIEETFRLHGVTEPWGN